MLPAVVRILRDERTWAYVRLSQVKLGLVRTGLVNIGQTIYHPMASITQSNLDGLTKRYTREGIGYAGAGKVLQN